MQHKHAIEVKYLPATNSRPSRFKLTSHRFNQSLTFSFNYTAASLSHMAAGGLHLAYTSPPMLRSPKGENRMRWRVDNITEF